MNRYKSSAQLKDLAKDKLDGRYGTAIGALMVIEAINYLVSTVVSIFIPGTGVVAIIISLLLSAIVSVLTGVFQTGLCLFNLNLACGQSYNINDVFYGYKNQPEKSIIVSLVYTLVNMVCTVPCRICAILFLNTKSTTHFILMLVTLLIGVIIYIPVNLAISQSYYLLLDFPKYSAREAISASCRIMKKHMGRLFYIELSFIPLMLLSLCSFGIGFLWLTPYMNMTYTCFFLDIMKPQSYN